MAGPRRGGSRRARAVLALAATTAAAVLAGCSTTPATPPSTKGPWAGQVIEIGAVYSTSGAGAAYGPQSIKGARLAVNRINAAGGVKGAKVVLAVHNDNSVPATAAAATTALITKDHALALLGPSLTNTAGAAHTVADQHHTVMMATSNTGLGIVGDCAYPCTWIFRDSLGEATAIPANIAEYAGAAHPATAAILYPGTTDTLGKQQAGIAATAMPVNHITLAADVAYDYGGTDLAGAVAQALAVHPDVLFIAGTSSANLVALIKTARAQHFLGQILGGNTFNSTAVATGVGATGVGAQSAAAWFEGNEFPANSTFVSSYEDAYHQTPDQFAAQAYTGVQLLANAASQAALTFDNVVADRREMLTALEGVSMQTPLGPFKFTASHDVQQPIWIVKMDGEGGYTLVTSELANPPA
ncbi:MAG TPA: ABC transporter substrate-binding protein [Acidimicrobiales bacterium]|nr:ABC transporter substrate-binding protein [Acidimicrobiales bacterium]